MKKTSKLQILISILSVIPIILVLAVYSKLPDKIPMHWNFNGDVGYDNKSSIFIVAIIPVFLAVLFPLLAKIDPKRQNYHKFISSYQSFQVLMMIFLILINVLTIVSAFNPEALNMPTAVIIMVGVLFTFIGNMMPRFRPNWFLGIKTPWTLSSEDVWIKTHRVGGRLFFLAGIITIISAFIPNKTVSFVIVMACILISAFVPIILSYKWSKKS